MERYVRTHLGSFEGLKVIEIGAGAGKVAALFALNGADVTVLDYAEGALERAKKLFERLHLDVELVLADALDLPASLQGRFDVAMSFGLTEHFTGEARVQINRAHFDLLRPGGVALIAVPNRYNPPYRLYKAAAEKLGTWKYGEEHPYDRAELVALARQFGAASITLLGESFWSSFRFFNVIGDWRKAMKLPPAREWGTPFDAHIGYSLVLAAQKPG